MKGESSRQYVNSWVWLSSNKTTNIRKLNFISFSLVLKYCFFFLFISPNHLKMQKPLLVHRPRENGWQVAVCQLLLSKSLDGETRSPGFESQVCHSQLCHHEQARNFSEPDTSYIQWRYHRRPTPPPAWTKMRRFESIQSGLGSRGGPPECQQVHDLSP